MGLRLKLFCKKWWWLFVAAAASVVFGLLSAHRRTENAQPVQQLPTLKEQAQRQAAEATVDLKIEHAKSQTRSSIKRAELEAIERELDLDERSAKLTKWLNDNL